MKRFIEWTSVLTIIVAVGVSSLLCGVAVANAIVDSIGHGIWQTAVCIPVIFAIGTVVSLFLLLGIKKLSDGMAE